MAVMIPPSAGDLGRMAERSGQYRAELAAAAAVPGTSLIVYERGHGTSLAMAEACAASGARTALLVVPRRMIPMWMEQLDRAHYAADASSGKKGCMAGICRQAAGYKGTKPVLFLASPNDMAETGHWHDAWRDKAPFGFVAVLDAENFRNMGSEKNQGLKTVADRSGNAALLVSRDVQPEKIRAMGQAWGLNAIPVLPRTAPAAASGCEAMGMDAD